MKSNRTVMMGLLKEKFSKQSLWKKIETEIAIMCAELPENSNESSNFKTIKQLNKIKNFLIENDIETEELNFLDEEIERYEKTTQISLYNEEEDVVEREIITKYARLGNQSEGIVGIHLPLNYNQLRKLTNGVYDKTGLIKFYISREKKVYGKIVAEIYEHSQKIPIATLVESKQIDKETEEPADKRIIMLGDRVERRKYNTIKEIQASFYIYRFISETNDEMMLLTVEPYDIGDYIIEGVSMQYDDYKPLTDSVKISTKLPFFFAQSIKNRIIKYSSHKSFMKKVKELGIDRNNFFEYPFAITFRKKNKSVIGKHPKWFKHMVWSWLTHAPVGTMNDYPMHLFIIGPPGSGKSILLESLHAKSKENRHIFSGVGSTLKYLIPSFKRHPAQLGYLAESNRFAYCDEFLRCVIRTRTSGDGSGREESVAMMNDLLEHQKREAGSGVSRVNVNMTARVIAATNFVKGIKNIEDLLFGFDESFCSRWLICHQTKEHVEMVRTAGSNLETYKTNVKVNDWVSLIDYLQSFLSKYDMNRVEKIYGSVVNLLSGVLRSHYDTRHLHHLECLMDGVVKTRCFLDGDSSFKAVEEDYVLVEKIWKNVVGSWINISDLKSMSLDERIFYLPENSQYLYWELVKKSMFHSELSELALKEMSESQFVEAMVVLKDNKIIVEVDGLFMPFYKNE